MANFTQANFKHQNRKLGLFIAMAVDNRPMYILLHILFSSEIVGELQLKKFGSFLEEYASQLKDIEDALGESVGDSWDMTLDPISLQVILYAILTIYAGLQIRVCTGKLFSYFSAKKCVVGTQKNRLNETVLLSTQNTCFY